MAWFYELRTPDNFIVKRDGGFATRNEAKAAGLADAKAISASSQSSKAKLAKVLVGQNLEKPTR
jgi:hypothetical protein